MSYELGVVGELHWEGCTGCIYCGQKGCAKGVDVSDLQEGSCDDIICPDASSEDEWEEATPEVLAHYDPKGQMFLFEGMKPNRPKIVTVDGKKFVKKTEVPANVQ